MGDNIADEDAFSTSLGLREGSAVISRLFSATFLFLMMLSGGFRLSWNEVGRMRWLRRLIQPRKCPECGGRLHKKLASEESFHVERADTSPGVRGAATPSGYIRRILFIPVYLECESCDYRVRIRNIRA